MHTNNNASTDRDKLSGFFRFAQGVLAAREQVILRMRDTGLGCFLENQIAGLPGLSLDVDEESWLVLKGWAAYCTSYGGWVDVSSGCR